MKVFKLYKSLWFLNVPTRFNVIYHETYSQIYYCLLVCCRERLQNLNGWTAFDWYLYYIMQLN